MRELAALREGWDEIEKIETQLLRAMSVQESLAHWLRLQNTFEHQLQQTAGLFAPARREALIELQNRLHRLAEWQKKHGKPVSFDPGAATTAD